MMRNVCQSLAVIMAIISASSCSSPQAGQANAPAAKFQKAGDITKINGQTLSLEYIEGHCILTMADGQLVKTKLTSACRFHRDEKNNIRTMPKSGGTVLLIESSINLTDRPGDCDTRVQAVLIKNRSVKLSKASNNVAICLPFRWDDVVFLGMDF